MIEWPKIKDAFRDVLELDDARVIDAAIGCDIANLFDTEPINLYLVGPPSSGKTEILRSLEGHPKVYPLSSLTPRTLLSGYKEKGVGADSPERSLLVKLQKTGKTIVVFKDFTTVLQLRAEARQEVLSQIREIADGAIRKAFGTGEEVCWSGKLAILAGVTPVIDEHHAVNQVLGERFLYYRITGNDSRAMAEMALTSTGREKEARERLSSLVTEFLEQFENPKIESISMDKVVRHRLISLSNYVARARTAVNRDRMTQALKFRPEPEGSARITKQLYTLGCGLAVIHGSDALGDAEYDVLKKVASDCLPSNRDLALRKMWERNIRGGTGGHGEKTKEIALYLNYPTTTTKLLLEDLMTLGLVERRQDGRGETAADSWRLSDECCALIEEAGVYDPLPP